MSKKYYKVTHDGVSTVVEALDEVDARRIVQGGRSLRRNAPAMVEVHEATKEEIEAEEAKPELAATEKKSSKSQNLQEFGGGPKA